MKRADELGRVRDELVDSLRREVARLEATLELSRDAVLTLADAPGMPPQWQHALRKAFEPDPAKVATLAEQLRRVS